MTHQCDARRPFSTWNDSKSTVTAPRNVIFAVVLGFTIHIVYTMLQQCDIFQVVEDIPTYGRYHTRHKFVGGCTDPMAFVCTNQLQIAPIVNRCEPAEAQSFRKRGEPKIQI